MAKVASNIDKDRAKMLRALRGKSAKRTTPEENQRLAKKVVDAIPPWEKVKAEMERIRKGFRR